MAKLYKTYAAERRKRLDPEGKEAIEVFSHAYVMGNALAQARQESTLTQRALAELSGVQQADISRIERGILAPTTSTLLRLVEAMGGRLRIDLPGTNERWSSDEPIVSTAVARAR